jgi:hypothetical protein
MRIKLAGIGALIAALTATMAIAATTAGAARPTQQLSVPITAAQSGGTLNGVFDVTRFAVNNAGNLVARGTFTGTVTDAAGNVTNITDSPVSAVVNPGATTGGCRILNLVLGPLHLNLLGLVVDLNQVHLNITAQPGPGNLLGNLLCSITHLLDGSGSTSAIDNLLARLNRLIGA